MSERVTVRFLIDGTVDEDKLFAERITFQTWQGKKQQRALIKLWRDGRVVRRLVYSDAPRIDHAIDADQAASP